MHVLYRYIVDQEGRVFVNRSCDALYLDYQSTTPCDKAVLEAMLPYLTHDFGNAHSRTHCYGWHAEEGVERSRNQIASVLGADAREIVFTSGATESNNLAIKGTALYLGTQNPKRRRFVTLATEHKCVLESFRWLSRQGFETVFIPVQPDGIVCLDTLAQHIDEHTALVSVMGVNNEIGVIQPLQRIGELCAHHGVLFHCDAAQALGRIALPVKALGIHMMSLSSHKIYGPKGIGALYIERRPIRVRLAPLFSGGGQERGLRSGTLPTFLCVGFGAAAEKAEALREPERARLTTLREMFLNLLNQELSHIYVNGSMEHRVPDNLNISFAGVEGEGLLMGIKELALSSGSACTSESLEPSYVLRALGVTEDLAHTSLRITFGRYTTTEQAHYAAQKIINAVRKLRTLSPVWDMVIEGIDLSTVKWITH